MGRSPFKQERCRGLSSNCTQKLCIATRYKLQVPVTCSGHVRRRHRSSGKDQDRDDMQNEMRGARWRLHVECQKLQWRAMKMELRVTSLVPGTNRLVACATGVRRAVSAMSLSRLRRHPITSPSRTLQKRLAKKSGSRQSQKRRGSAFIGMPLQKLSARRFLRIFSNHLQSD